MHVPASESKRHSCGISNIGVYPSVPDEPFWVKLCRVWVVLRIMQHCPNTVVSYGKQMLHRGEITIGSVWWRVNRCRIPDVSIFHSQR